MAGAVPVLTAPPHQETPSPTHGTESLEQTGTTIEHQLQVYKHGQCMEMATPTLPHQLNVGVTFPKGRAGSVT